LPARRWRISDRAGRARGCRGREHQARQGRREHSGCVARVRL